MYTVILLCNYDLHYTYINNFYMHTYNIIYYRNRRSRRNRPSSTELSTPIDNLTISHQMNNKIGSESKPHLLCAIKLKGSYANTIFVSPNFKTFVTKDDEGICYIIEMIE